MYDTTPGDVDIMKLQSIGNNKQTNVLLYTNNGEGGIIRGFSNIENKTTGLALAVSNNNTITTCLNIVNTSNVGVGTPSPARQFHVVDHRNPASWSNWYYEGGKYFFKCEYRVYYLWWKFQYLCGYNR